MCMTIFWMYQHSTHCFFIRFAFQDDHGEIVSPETWYTFCYYGCFPRIAVVEISFDKVVGHLFIDSVSFVTHEVGTELGAPW